MGQSLKTTDPKREKLVKTCAQLVVLLFFVIDLGSEYVWREEEENGGARCTQTGAILSNFPFSAHEVSCHPGRYEYTSVLTHPPFKCFGPKTQVDGVRNSKVHSIFFSDLPITNAMFTTPEEVCFGPCLQ